MFKPRYEFEWNMLGIYNYKQEGKFSCFFEYLNKNLDKDGDLIEVGVYRGSSLLSVAMFLKEKGSSKKVYGYDSFKGFPDIYHENDSIEKFEELFQSKKITIEHFKKIESANRIRELIKQNEENNIENISSSGDFSNTSKKLLMKKIDFIGLNNIILLDGPFNETMDPTYNKGPDKLLAGIVDCDLYISYQTSLNFIWPKLIRGGGLYLDEYFSLKFPGGKIATDEFLENHDGLLKKNPDDNLLFERWMLFK